MYCEGETRNEWIFAALFSPNVYAHFSAQTRKVLNERLQRMQMPSKPAFTAEAGYILLFPEQISLIHSPG